MMLAVAIVAIGLCILSSFGWLQDPHVDVTIFNETSGPISDLRVTFPGGYRTAEQLAPGRVATTQVQWPEVGALFSYRDSGGILRETQAPNVYGATRGFLEFHVTDERIRVVKDVY
jgi:hypothetical protein